MPTKVPPVVSPSVRQAREWDPLSVMSPHSLPFFVRPSSTEVVHLGQADGFLVLWEATHLDITD